MPAAAIRSGAILGHVQRQPTGYDMIEKHLRLPAVIEATGLSRSTIYDKMKDGTFPRPVNISARAIAWPESVIAEWLAQRVQQAA